MKPVDLSPLGFPQAGKAPLPGAADTADLRDAAAVTGARGSRAAPLSVGAIWEQMRAGWSNGRPLRAEQFLTAEFLATSGEEGAVDVIYAEFALTEAHGGRPLAAEYLERFPQFASGLAKQLSVHAAIELLPDDVTRDHVAPARQSDAIVCPGNFGRYLLVAPLDVGGQSRVYRAVHPDLGKEVVIKIARQASDTYNPQHDAALATEAKILAGLSHPNLAQIYDAGVIDGRAFLAMEYVRGRTLAQHARQTEVTPQQAAAIVAKTARALATVHAQGILHLDIKPKNIVIDEQGEPRLIDFGLSRVEHAWSPPPTDEGLAGTLEFMAPEQARCEADRLGPATDIFSLGGVLYYLLTGSPLFAAKSARESLLLAEKCEWDRSRLAASAAPAALRCCCEQALSAEPAARFASAEAFATELEKPTGHGWNNRQFAAIAAIALAALVGMFAVGKTYLAPPAVPEVAPRGLEIQVWQEGIRKDLSQAVPLLSGDELRIEATVPPRSIAVLLLINSAGELRMLKTYPSSVTRETQSYPDARSAAPLTGQPGTEGVLLISGKTQPSADDLATWWRGTGTSWPQLPEYAILRVSDAAITVEQSGRDLGDPVRKSDPQQDIKNRLDEFRQHLRGRELHCDGLVFCHSR